METESAPSQIKHISRDFKKILFFIIRMLVSIGILYILYTLVKWEDAFHALTSAHLEYVIIALLLVTGNLGIRIWKWHIMLRSLKASPTASEAFGSVMLGISLGSWTPGELGEFAGRALHITEARRTHLIGLALVDKTQIFLVTSCAGIAGLCALFLENLFLTYALFLLSIVLSVFFLVRLDIVSALGHRFNNRFLKAERMKSILDGYALLSLKDKFITLNMTIIFHFIIVFQMYYLINAFEPLPLWPVFLATSALLFSKSFLPISLGDLGIREAGSIVFFSMFGIAQASALNASLLLFIINILIPSIIGIFFLRYHHIDTIRSTAFSLRKRK
jgi:uncharacterized protein (TIRG00374 family)